jgi:hypothetical protein
VAARAAALARVERSIGLTAEQGDWVSDFACTLRQRRLSVLADASAPAPTDPAVLAERLRAEREEVLLDLEAYLGPDRYQALREIGGIGLFNELVDCEGPAPAADSATPTASPTGPTRGP